MACNTPIRAYRCNDGSIIFEESRKTARDIQHHLLIPCGKCFGCKLERSRQWALRCMHEASLHEENCFITLTYNEKHLPIQGELCYTDFQLFMKRLRKKFQPKKIRFFMCGEYGEDNERPHFHACLFNVNFSDRVYFKTTASGSKIYTSSTLDRLWSDSNNDPIGFTTVGDVNIASAGYVARYVVKKTFGRYDNRLEAIDYETGEVYKKTPEFCRMSLKPGIGYGFYKKWFTDIFPQDICVVQGIPTKPPKYYYEKLKVEHPDVFEEVSTARAISGIDHAADNIEERREVKEKVIVAKLRLLKREQF